MSRNISTNPIIIDGSTRTSFTKPLSRNSYVSQSFSTSNRVINAGSFTQGGYSRVITSPPNAHNSFRPQTGLAEKYMTSPSLNIN
jgi:hypothetical protein